MTPDSDGSTDPGGSAAMITLALAVVTATGLGIVRTLIDNGTGYLTVGGRILDAQESVGLLGLPGTLIPLLAAVILLFIDVSAPRRALCGVAAVALAVGQFLPSATGARSNGAARWTDAPGRRLPLDLSLASTLFGILIIIVLAAASARRERDLVIGVTGAFLCALLITVGQRSAGTAFRWNNGPDRSVTVGLWLSLFVALTVAAIAALSIPRRRNLPVPLFAACSALVGAGAVLLAG